MACHGVAAVTAPMVSKRMGILPLVSVSRVRSIKGVIPFLFDTAQGIHQAAQ